MFDPCDFVLFQSDTLRFSLKHCVFGSAPRPKTGRFEFRDVPLFRFEVLLLDNKHLHHLTGREHLQPILCSLCINIIIAINITIFARA